MKETVRSVVDGDGDEMMRGKVDRLSSSGKGVLGRERGRGLLGDYSRCGFFFFLLHPSVCSFHSLRRFGKLAVDSRDEDGDEVGRLLAG